MPHAHYEYGPFAEPIRVTGPAATLNPFRFSTKRTDNTTDLVVYEYRAYSPSTGRWLNRDPIEEMGGLNPYLLCANDAVNRYDPNGQLWWPITGTASVAFGWVLAQATGSSYTLTDAAIDFTLGAVGPGLIGQFKKLASLRKCIKVSAHLKAIQAVGAHNEAGQGDHH